ncbi:MAG: hypothetical protein F4164_12570 [Gemmatimonadales bacterium]|nr:hypothetical protein [Gemmatimonadales bacterium]MYG50167.1 hypothetical protein [Gemmatimonadales bacterium]MYK01336.1 hypothetical protein [Candidatus Palauibacter ramosifaciens]
MERSSSLSPREVDELEDHLRARFELEREMTPERPPARAFNTVCAELGEAAALSREFAKAGRRRWRPLLLAGWAMFAVSFFLPISRMAWVDPGALHPDLVALVGSQRPYELLWTLITMGATDAVLAVWIAAVVLLPNLPLLMTLPALLGSRRSARRWLLRVLGGMGIVNLGLGVFRVVSPSPFPYDEGAVAFSTPGAGYWLWSASFALAAAALWLRGRSWAADGPAEPVAERAT